MDVDVLWSRTALCRGSRLERLLLPLPLADSGMVKTTPLHYSMCR